MKSNKMDSFFSGYFAREDEVTLWFVARGGARVLCSLLRIEKVTRNET